MSKKKNNSLKNYLLIAVIGIFIVGISVYFFIALNTFPSFPTLVKFSKDKDIKMVNDKLKPTVDAFEIDFKLMSDEEYIEKMGSIVEKFITKNSQYSITDDFQESSWLELCDQTNDKILELQGIPGHFMIPTEDFMKVVLKIKNAVHKDSTQYSQTIKELEEYLSNNSWLD